MKYISEFSYSTIDEITESIQYTIDTYGEDFIREGKVGDWIIVAPKIRRLQEKANQLKIRAAKEEVKQRKAMERAVEQGKNPKPARLWELLQKKIDALEANAREYELEAIELGQGNDYLRRVQRVARLKGALKVNNEKYAIADSEERRELMKTSSAMKSIIKEEETIIKNKLKSDVERIKELEGAAKQKQTEANKKKIEGQVDPVSMYFKDKTAERIRNKATQNSN